MSGRSSAFVAVCLIWLAAPGCSGSGDGGGGAGDRDDAGARAGAAATAGAAGDGGRGNGTGGSGAAGGEASGGTTPGGAAGDGGAASSGGASPAGGAGPGGSPGAGGARASGGAPGAGGGGIATGGGTSAGGGAGTGGAPSAPYGGGAFVATLLRAASNDDFTFGGTVSPAYWVTRRSYAECDFAAVIDVAPGAGNRWTFTAEYATLAPDQSCADVTAWTTAPLCTISDSDKNCAAQHVAMSMVGPACFRGHAVVLPGDNVGSDGAGSGGVVAMTCRDAAGDGATHFQGTGQASVTGGAFYGGNVVRSPNQERAYWLHAGAPLAACGGMIAVPSAPGAGNTWHVAVAASTTALAAGQSCSDLSYATTSDLCTITGTAKSCAFVPAAVTVPTGGCLQLRGTCTGGTCQAGAGFSPSYGLDCSPRAAAPFAGDATYQSAGSGAFDAAHAFDVGPWGISDANFTNRQFSQQYWLAPPGGLARCGGALVFENAVTGTGEFDVGLAFSTAAPAPGQSCLDVAYTPTAALCAVDVGEKSCYFAPTAVGIPGGACFALFASNGGDPSVGASPFNWQVTCAPR